MFTACIRTVQPGALNVQMSKPSPLLSGLNSEQQAAVSAPPGCHYLVLAGAGCGKTTVLSRRIAFLSTCGIPLHSILALTFTRKAAGEMAGRTRKLTGESNGTTGPVVATFHSFSLSLLSDEIDGRKNFSRIGYRGAPRWCEEKERLRILNASSTRNERKELGVDLLSLDAQIERLGVFPDRVAVTPEKKELLLSISRRFGRAKRKEDMWDFSDLTGGAVRLFERVPETASYYRSRFSTILVDEFQDTNPLQIRLLHLLLGKEIYLFAVGDDDQAIYGFRGADIRPTLEFTSHFTGARIFKLQTNYRSLPAILTAANRIFRHKPFPYRKVLVSGKYKKGEGEKPSRHQFENEERMVDWIIEEAARCSRTLGVPADSMAVLCRLNRSVDRIRDRMAEKKMVSSQCPRVLTVHRSKGLEFPVVFLCDLEESIFPNYRMKKKTRIRTFVQLIHYIISKSRERPECDLEEEKRLFYVGVTRAQKRLFFLSARNRIFYNRKVRMRPSRFIRLI